MQGQLVVGEGRPQIVVQGAQRYRRRGPERMAFGRRRRVVAGEIGASAQLFGVAAVIGGDGDADPHRRLCVGVTDVERTLQHTYELGRTQRGMRAPVQARQQHQEIILADAAHAIAGPHRGLERKLHPAAQRIAGGIAEREIGLADAVCADDQHAQRQVRARLRQKRLDIHQRVGVVQHAPSPAALTGTDRPDRARTRPAQVHWRSAPDRHCGRGPAGRSSGTATATACRDRSAP